MAKHIYTIEDLMESLSSILEKYENVEVNRYEVTFTTENEDTITISGGIQRA